MSEKFPSAEAEKREVVGAFGVDQYLGKKIVKGIKGSESIEKKMEDAWVGEKIVAGGKFFGVFDGHGEGGAEGAKLAAEKLHEKFAMHMENGLGPREAMRQAFLDMDKEIEGDQKASGATAVVAFFTEGKLLIANVGDARAILVKKGGVERLSYDHKLKDPEERDRITKAGGKIIEKGGNPYLEAPITGGTGYLNLARSLGDKKFGDLVSPEPTIRELEIGPEDKKVILGSDGLWDYVTDAEAADIARKEPDAQRASGALCDAVIMRGREKNYVDNTTALVINFNEQGPAA